MFSADWVNNVSLVCNFFLRGAVRAVNYLDSPQIVRRVERLYKRGLQCSTTVSFVRLNPRGDDC